MNKTITTNYEKTVGDTSIHFAERDKELSGGIFLKIGGYSVRLTRDEFNSLLACTDTVREALKGIK